ncbi:MAG: antitoxin [Nevskiales bacterium]
MSTTAKVFMTGRSQAVRLPKAYRLDCDEVIVERRGEKLVLTPKQAKDWSKFFARPGVDEAFLSDRRDAPPKPRKVF